MGFFQSFLEGTLPSQTSWNTETETVTSSQPVPGDTVEQGKAGRVGRLNIAAQDFTALCIKPTHKNLYRGLVVFVVSTTSSLFGLPLTWALVWVIGTDVYAPANSIWYIWKVLEDLLALYLLCTWKGIWNIRFEFHKIDWYYNIAVGWTCFVIGTHLFMAVEPNSPVILPLIIGLWGIGAKVIGVLYIVSRVQLLSLGNSLFGLLKPFVVVEITSTVLGLFGLLSGFALSFIVELGTSGLAFWILFQLWRDTGRNGNGTDIPLRPALDSPSSP